MAVIQGADPKTLATLSLAILRTHGEIGRTKLIKLAYLSDYFARRTLGHPITSYEYRWADHGPFDKAFFSSIGALAKQGLEEKYFPDWDGHRYEIPSEELKVDALDPSEREIVERVISVFAPLPLDQLLDVVYTKTEPMILARKSGKAGIALPMDVCDNAIPRKFGLDFEAYVAAKEASNRGDVASIDDLIDAL